MLGPKVSESSRFLNVVLSPPRRPCISAPTPASFSIVATGLSAASQLALVAWTAVGTIRPAIFSFALVTAPLLILLVVTAPFLTLLAATARFLICFAPTLFLGRLNAA